MSNLFQFYFCRDALELIPKRGQLRRSQVIGAHHQGRRRTFILHLRIAPKPLSVDVLQEILEASDHAANAVGQGRPPLILHLLVLIDWWSWRRSWQRSSGLRTAFGLNKTGNVIDLYKVLVSFLEVAGSSTVLSVFYDITPIERRPVPLVVAFRIKVELEARHDSVRNLAGTANPVGRITGMFLVRAATAAHAAHSWPPIDGHFIFSSRNEEPNDRHPNVRRSSRGNRQLWPKPRWIAMTFILSHFDCDFFKLNSNLEFQF